LPAGRRTSRVGKPALPFSDRRRIETAVRQSVTTKRHGSVVYCHRVKGLNILNLIAMR
jgi:hypothetical protein